MGHYLFLDNSQKILRTLKMTGGMRFGDGTDEKFEDERSFILFPRSIHGK